MFPYTFPVSLGVRIPFSWSFSTLLRSSLASLIHSVWALHLLHSSHGLSSSPSLTLCNKWLSLCTVAWLAQQPVQGHGKGREMWCCMAAAVGEYFLLGVPWESALSSPSQCFGFPTPPQIYFRCSTQGVKGQARRKVDVNTYKAILTSIFGVGFLWWLWILTLLLLREVPYVPVKLCSLGSCVMGLTFVNSCCSDTCFWFYWHLGLVLISWGSTWCFDTKLIYFFKANFQWVCACVCSSCNLPEDMTLERARNIFLLLEDKVW